MPRYFFHVRRGQVTILDREGVEFADLTEAIEEAYRRAVQIEAGEAIKGVPPSTGMIILADHSRTIFEVPLNADDAARWAKPDWVN